MIDWWNSLSGLSLFFWSVAIFSTVFQVVLFAASLFGADMDGDFDGDGFDDAADSAKLLSLRAIVAFGIGFGWAGALGIGNGWSTLKVSSISLASGLVFVFVIYGMMRALVAMQDKGGNLDFNNSIGTEGRVYVTIPPGREGEGQIEVMLQGRLMTLAAITDSTEALSPGKPVKVEAVSGRNLLVVNPVA